MRQLTFEGVFPTIQANTNARLLGGSKCRIKENYPPFRRRSGVTIRPPEHPRLRPPVRRPIVRTGKLAAKGRSRTRPGRRAASVREMLAWPASSALAAAGMAGEVAGEVAEPPSASPQGPAPRSMQGRGDDTRHSTASTGRCARSLPRTRGSGAHCTRSAARGSPAEGCTTGLPSSS